MNPLKGLFEHLGIKAKNVKPYEARPKSVEYDDFWVTHKPPLNFGCACVKRHSTSQGYHQTPEHCGQADRHTSEPICDHY